MGSKKYQNLIPRQRPSFAELDNDVLQGIMIGTQGFDGCGIYG